MADGAEATMTLERVHSSALAHDLRELLMRRHIPTVDAVISDRAAGLVARRTAGAGEFFRGRLRGTGAWLDALMVGSVGVFSVRRRLQAGGYPGFSNRRFLEAVRVPCISVMSIRVLRESRQQRNLQMQPSDAEKVTSGCNFPCTRAPPQLER